MLKDYKKALKYCKLSKWKIYSVKKNVKINWENGISLFMYRPSQIEINQVSN